MTEELRNAAEILAGRPITVQKTNIGLYCVEWFNFNTMPPPPGKTEEEALENFISYLSKHKEENADAIDDNTTGQPVEEDEGPFGTR